MDQRVFPLLKINSVGLDARALASQISLFQISG